MGLFPHLDDLESRPQQRDSWDSKHRHFLRHRLASPGSARSLRADVWRRI